ncbi:unnamed protein product [Trichobilharzia szidati]|nr:unnamed protein product [Trichobilharzia szidati]
MAENNELIYHTCYAYLIHHLPMKKNLRIFDRSTAENEIEKIKCVSPVRLCLMFTEDCLRIKRFGRNTNRYKWHTLFYEQIQFYCSTHDENNLIILGIISPSGRKRGYQYLYVENKDDLRKVEETLHQIAEHRLQILKQVPEISQLNISNSNNV